MQTRIIIAGGTGFIGKALAQKLSNEGYEIVILQRSNSNTSSSYKTSQWNLDSQTIDSSIFTDNCIVINLTGENIAKSRWTKSRKERLISSRVKANELLAKALQKQKCSPKLVINTSAVGFYGTKTTSDVYDETCPPANDFLGTCCRLWEESAKPLKSIALRHLTLRLGIVLGQNGGALQKMVQPIRYGIGLPLGTGKQIVPWIHLDDLISFIIYCIKNESVSGTYNAIASGSDSNSELTKAISKTINRPFFYLPTPSFIFKLILGEMADMLLEGSVVSNEKIKSSGYQFSYHNIASAIENLLKK